MYGTKLKFVRTCGACPEQYDVLSPDNSKAVGYVRYRYGTLYASYFPPEKESFNDEWSETVFCENIGGELDGLMSSEEKDKYLPIVARKIAEKYFDYRKSCLYADIFGE